MLRTSFTRCAPTLWAPTRRAHQPHASRVVRMTKWPPAAVGTGQEQTNGVMSMRNHPSNPGPCHSIDHGHNLDPASGAGNPIRNGNWAPARLKAVMEYQVGMVVYVYVEGARQRFLTHDPFTIGRLLNPARSLGSDDFGALFNEEFLVIALPDLRSGSRLATHRCERDMLRFSVSRTPLGACIMPRDDEVEREFAALTAGWVS